MTPYDPDQTPEAGAWLALDESERIGRIAAHHAAAGITPPNARLHAALHAVVENQIAGEVATVRETVARLCTEGLTPARGAARGRFGPGRAPDGAHGPPRERAGRRSTTMSANCTR